MLYKIQFLILVDARAWTGLENGGGLCTTATCHQFALWSDGSYFSNLDVPGLAVGFNDAPPGSTRGLFRPSTTAVDDYFDNALESYVCEKLCWTNKEEHAYYLPEDFNVKS